MLQFGNKKQSTFMKLKSNWRCHFSIPSSSISVACLFLVAKDSELTVDIIRFPLGKLKIEDSAIDT